MIDTLEGVEFSGEATQASEAITHILETKPDVVILDLWLEGTSGLYVLREIKAQLPLIDVIVFTNHDSHEYRKACLQEGANYFLGKTKEYEKLKLLLVGLVGEHRLNPDKTLSSTLE